MHSDVKFLLAVQLGDLELYALEDRLAALGPRRAALEREREKVASQLERTRSTILSEESQHREAMVRVDSNKKLVERSQRAYESVTSPKEANAAMTQLEQTQRMVAESERDAAEVQGRINELRHRASDLETALADVETRQLEARTELQAESTAIEAEIAEARTKRERTSRDVPRGMLSTYDRVRVRRRGETVFPLRGPSCSACDTAIPTQRRAAMAATGSLEMCEGCGMLLYAGD